MFKHNFRKPLLNTEIRRRGIYLLPNIFTTVALIAGFYAIVQAMDHHFDDAAKAIFVAMILDTLDGRVARLTHTQSAFGAEYDSLSDMVCFGAAPALVMYEWALKDLGDRKSTRLNSSHSQISYAVFCLKKKKKNTAIAAPLVGASVDRLVDSHSC